MSEGKYKALKMVMMMMEVGQGWTRMKIKNGFNIANEQASYSYKVYVNRGEADDDALRLGQKEGCARGVSSLLLEHATTIKVVPNRQSSITHTQRILS